jgi:hypothetical protein
MIVERANSDAFSVSSLPDGSKVLIDPARETVFALNSTAGAAWDACSGPTSVASLTEEMQRSFHPQVTEELAQDAIAQLQDKKLVSISEPAPKRTRRQMIAALGAVAVPLVVSLTLAEQKALAGGAGSVRPCAAAIPCK